jgi:hypothetical protein
MAKTRKIFIGSSSERLHLAKALKKVIDDWSTNTEAITWDRAFGPSRALIERIETLADDYELAVFLWTPDVLSGRAEQPFKTGVPNVLFEYGFLAACLTRDRVAICQFDNADLPTDLGGVKVFKFKKYEAQDGTLDQETTEELRHWVTQMPLLAVTPIVRVHGYSGTWHVRADFTRWRGLVIQEPDKVFFNGSTFLVLGHDGRHGSGIQTGDLFIRYKGYTADWKIVNEVLDRGTHVDEQGGLHASFKNILRAGPYNEPVPPPHPIFHEDLSGKEFYVNLKVREAKTLADGHQYDPGITVLQEATEVWNYLGH